MLTLPIKRKWFDMIAADEKPEEYREMTDYYTARFRDYIGRDEFFVKIRAGYRKDSPVMKLTCILGRGYGKPEWGAEPGKEYYILYITGHTKPYIPNQ